MGRLKAWLLVLLMIGLLVAAVFAAMSGVFYAWLSVFPEHQSQLRTLEIKVWISWISAVVLLGGDTWLVVHVVRSINRQDRLRPAAHEHRTS